MGVKPIINIYLFAKYQLFAIIICENIMKSKIISLFSLIFGIIAIIGAITLITLSLKAASSLNPLLSFVSLMPFVLIITFLGLLSLVLGLITIFKKEERWINLHGYIGLIGFIAVLTYWLIGVFGSHLV